MKILEDQHHIDCVLRGDSSAYRFLVERYKKMVYSIALRVMLNVEDAAQESFVKAYQQLNSFERKSKFSTWLYTITYRTCINKLKENHRGSLFFSDELADNKADTNPSPIDVLDEAEQSQIIKKAIEQLPPIDALLITLYYLDENSIKEIQNITGLTTANIKVRLFRARKELETKLQFLV